VKLLDHGSVDLVEHWGSDQRVIESARMSTQKGFEGWGDDSPCIQAAGAHDVKCKRGTGACVAEHKIGDEKLLRYLWTHKHASPFEFAGAVIEVQAPIFVFREWHRHRVFTFNEASARYAPLPDTNYIPGTERLLIGSDEGNRQAGSIKGSAHLTLEEAQSFRWELKEVYAACERLYQNALAAGVPKELARVCLPVGRYSRMRASANLRNWLGFLALRMDKAAQWEIRQYANAVHQILAELFPRTLELFDER
jgi:thymidylate synthase (FAD)